MAKDLMWIAAGGTLGSILRYFVYLFLPRVAGVPGLATLVVNVAGCFALGWLAKSWDLGLDENRPLLLLAAIGFLGSFTTFSALGGETFALLRESTWTGYGRASAMVFANLSLGLLAIALGRWLALK